MAVKDGQFLINQQPFYFKGFGKHEDSAIHGRGFDEAANVMDFQLMRWIGANSFRTAHLFATPETDKVAELVDVLALNRYYGWYLQSGDLAVAKAKLREELQGWTKRCPGKPIMTTEYGADTVAGLYDVDPVMFTEEFQVEYLRANHAVFTRDRKPKMAAHELRNRWLNIPDFGYKG